MTPEQNLEPPQLTLEQEKFFAEHPNATWLDYREMKELEAENRAEEND